MERANRIYATPDALFTHAHPQVPLASLKSQFKIASDERLKKKFNSKTNQMIKSQKNQKKNTKICTF